MPAINGTMIQYFHWDYPADGMLWTELARNATDLARAGITALWLPPAYKGQSPTDAGYGTYDLWDLGEFNQKGAVPTKYGSRAQLEAAIQAAHTAGLQIYLDIVFNDKGGADATERTLGTPVNSDNRNIVMGPAREIEVWTLFTFPGRGGRYSSMQWHWYHFDSLDHDVLTSTVNTIYRLRDKQFQTPVDLEHGNFDYLMFDDLDMGNDEVRTELKNWGQWIVQTLNIDGFRIDAAKHIRFTFFPDWLDFLHATFPGRSFFSVGEYFSGDINTLEFYLQQTGGRISLFDFPLYFNFRAASEGGSSYDLRNLLNNTIMAQNPVLAVTFVDNHDTFRGRTVQDWFKPLAYATILLREQGYPCVFYGDYYPVTGHASQRGIIDRLLAVRRESAFGPQRDYFDQADCVGWTRTGDGDHPRSIAVLMSNGQAGSKAMDVARPNTRFIDATGNISGTVTTDAKGVGQFGCNGGSVSVWVEQ